MGSNVEEKLSNRTLRQAEIALTLPRGGERDFEP
jgi:hypothetical protein